MQVTIQPVQPIGRFNPCFNGFFFSIALSHALCGTAQSFNPCFNGFFFSILFSLVSSCLLNRFNPCFNGFFFSICCKNSIPRIYHRVSILVLMDSSFQSSRFTSERRSNWGFNPCFNGFFFSIWSAVHHAAESTGFNPCFNGFFFSIKG